VNRTPLTALALVGAGAVLARRRAAAVPRATFPTVSGEAVEVLAEDGVALAVEVHGPPDASATVVLAHGYELSQRLWARQVLALRASRPDLRVVTYDHRGHGRSAGTPARSATLAQLGRDLLAVLDAVAPAGPVLLAGHSMGGMTLMSFAEQFPGALGSRVVGAALVSTSPGRLTEVTYGLPKALAQLAQRSLPWFNEQARRREAAGKRKPARPGIAGLLFGKDPVPADVVATLEVMAACPAATVADFHATFVDHQRITALAALAQVPTLVLCGSRDRICPLDHSQDIADALPHAQLVVYPGAGHMLILERADEVSRRLVELADVLPRPEGRRRTQVSPATDA
jgi:pimeloyl-ACP methyl ester carboxylesterase